MSAKRMSDFANEAIIRPSFSLLLSEALKVFFWFVAF